MASSGSGVVGCQLPASDASGVGLGSGYVYVSTSGGDGDTDSNRSDDLPKISLSIGVC